MRAECNSATLKRPLTRERHALFQCESPLGHFGLHRGGKRNRAATWKCQPMRGSGVEHGSYHILNHQPIFRRTAPGSFPYPREQCNPHAERRNAVSRQRLWWDRGSSEAIRGLIDTCGGLRDWIGCIRHGARRVILGEAGSIRLGG
jgi:hypothetical protein